MAFLAFHNPKQRTAKHKSAPRAKKARSIGLIMRANPAPNFNPVGPQRVTRTKRSSAKRSSAKRSSAKRSSAKRSSGGSFVTNFKASLTNKNTLYMAGGALLGNAATNYLLNQPFAKKLPGLYADDGVSVNPTARALYASVIPLTAAAAVRKKNVALSDGLIVGSIINLATGYIAAQVAKDSTSQLGLLLPPKTFAALPIKFSGFRGVKAYPNGKSIPQAPASFKGVYNSPQPFVRDAFAKS